MTNNVVCAPRVLMRRMQLSTSALELHAAECFVLPVASCKAVRIRLHVLHAWFAVCRMVRAICTSTLSPGRTSSRPGLAPYLDGAPDLAMLRQSCARKNKTNERSARNCRGTRALNSRRATHRRLRCQVFATELSGHVPLVALDEVWPRIFEAIASIH